MYRIMHVRDDGFLQLWSTDPKADAKEVDNAELVTSVPVDSAPVYAPVNPVIQGLRAKLDVSFEAMMKGQAGTVRGFKTTLQFVKFHNLWRDAERSIRDGTIIFAHDPANGLRYVMKQQQIDAVDVDFVVTPGPAAAELRALMHLDVYAREGRLGPFFCELVDHSIFFGGSTVQLNTTMRALSSDLINWLRGNVKDKFPVCKERPPMHIQADPFHPWVYSTFAGYTLATSAFKPDRELFNLILRGTLLQVFIGLAQAQRNLLFSHNDLHGGNVLFDLTPLKLSRLVCTGAGTFLIPKNVAGVRMIDFQHAAFDTYNADGDCSGRVTGNKDDAHNHFSLSYDVYRLCEYLVVWLLKPKALWKNVDPDLAAFLWQMARLKGKAQVDEIPVMKPGTEVLEWRPFILHGPTPEDALRHPVFDCFRAEPGAAADVIAYERTPTPCAQERYLRARILRNFAPFHATREDVFAAFEPPPRAIPEGASKHLHVFAVNYTKTMMGKAMLMHLHAPHDKAHFLYMELVLLHAVLDHVWGAGCAAEVQARLQSDDPKVNMNALADAVAVVVHADWLVFGRPTGDSFDKYHPLVRAALKLECVRAVSRSQVERPRITAAQERRLLGAKEDGDLNAFEALFYGAVMHQ